MQASTSRRKRRSSSILKVSGRSPSRNAFQDLNGRDPLDLQEGQAIPLKREVEPKSRRPSRRVSFADTYQVKEYLTDKDAASLGLWENSQTEDPAPQAAEGVSANAVEPATSSKPTISASGLDTLLNGPIKSPAAAHDPPVADPEEHQPTAACDVSVAMDMTSALSCEEELDAQQTRTFDPEAENAAPLVDSKSFLARLMGGAGYHGNSTSPDLSLSCSSHAFNNTIIFGQDPNVTSSLDMTCMDESFAPQDDRILPSDPSTTTAQQQDSKGTIDAGSFLSKFMQQRPSQSESRPVDCGDRTVVFGAADEQNDMELTVAVSTLHQETCVEKERGTGVPVGVARPLVSSNRPVVRGIDEDTQFAFTPASCIGRSREQAPLMSGTNLYRQEEDEKTCRIAEDMDFTVAVSSISAEQGNVPAQVFRTEEALQDKTTVFRNTDCGADMEFTTAISSITTEQGNNVPQEVFISEETLQDKTTVFRNMDSGADMEFTTAVSTISTEQGTVPAQLALKTEFEDTTQDKTTVFRNMDSGADMDFTTTINSIKTEQEIISKQPTVRTEEASQEKTILFNNIESGADMEFTANIGTIGTELETVPKQLHPTAEETNNNTNANTGEHHHPYHAVSVQPQNPTQEKTIVFSNIESAADMDFTTTIRNHEEPHDLVPQQRVSLVPQEAQQDKTTVFSDAETGADMEFTAALPSTRLDTDHVSSTVPPALDVQAVQQGPNTEGDMEFTACVSSLQPEADCGGKSSLVDTVFTSPEKGAQCAGGSSDKTKVFGAGSRDGVMEMTASVAEQTAEDGRQPPEQVPTEETRVFSAEDAPGMELTCQFDVTEKPSRLNTLKRRLSEMAGETTHVFCDEDTARMDLTVGISNTLDLPQVSSGNDTLATGDRLRGTGGSILDTQMLSKKQEETLDGDKTRVFGRENTARMDLTESVGGILASTSSSGGNQTSVGGVFQRDSLKMFDCVGSGKEASLQEHGSYGGPEGLSEKIHTLAAHSGTTYLPKSTTEAPERTQVFSAEDGGMEMTQCQTGVLSADTSLLMSAKRRKMSEEGYGVSAGASRTSSTATLNLPTMTAAAPTADSAGIVRSDVTASTEMASCKNLLQVTRETPGRPLSSLTDLADFQPLGKPRSSLPLFKNRTSLMSTARRASAAAGVAHTSEPAGYSQHEEKPEVVVTSPTLVETLEKMSTTLPVIGSEEHGTDTSPDGAEANVGVCHVENKSSDPLFSVAPFTADDRADQADDRAGADDIGQEFDLHNEQPIELVETTAEFLAAVCQENLTLPAAKPPAVTSQCSAPLPSDLSHANSTLLDVTCRSNSSSDRSVLGTTVAEGQDDMTLPQQGNLSVSQFLTYCNINIQDQGKDRRSVMPFIKSDPPESLSEHLEILSVLLPQAHVYEWSCNKLQERIGSTREVVKQQEERLDHDNPALFSQAQEMLQDGRLKEVDQLKRDMESLRSCCKKQAKTEWHEWTCKMTGTIVESLKEGEADIKAGVEELEGSLQTIDQTLASLDTVEKDLEDAIADLEGVQLPSDEDMQRYKDQQAALLQKEEELSAAQKEEEQLKSTHNSLQAERESLELRLDQLQLQQSEQGLQPEEDNTAAQELEEQVKALNRLQGLVEWDLEELSASQLRVTFLQKSLQLTVTYTQGDVLDKCRKVTDIQLESLLADGAACWAHLCHRMVLGAVDQAQLVQAYTTAQAQSKLLLRLSLLVSEARDLGDEVRDIVFRRPFTTVEGTDLTVEFSSVEAHTKFFVTFNLTPGAYPHHPVKCTCRHRIGSLSPSTVEDVLHGVPSGRGYLSRMVQAVEELIKQHASVSPPV